MVGPGDLTSLCCYFLCNSVSISAVVSSIMYRCIPGNYTILLGKKKLDDNGMRHVKADQIEGNVVQGKSWNCLMCHLIHPCVEKNLVKNVKNCVRVYGNRTPVGLLIIKWLPLNRYSSYVYNCFSASIHANNIGAFTSKCWYLHCFWWEKQRKCFGFSN